jgi:hypothetical protein
MVRRIFPGVLLALAALPAWAASPLSVELKPTPGFPYQGGHDLFVSVVFTNVSKNPVTFITYDTVLFDDMYKLFTVEELSPTPRNIPYDKQEERYCGSRSHNNAAKQLYLSAQLRAMRCITASHLQLNNDNLVTIPPAKSVQQSVNLLKFFKFPEAGSYRITYSGPLLGLREMDRNAYVAAYGKRPDSLIDHPPETASDPLELKIDPKPTPIDTTMRPQGGPLADRLKFSGCTSENEKALGGASAQAREMVHRTVMAFAGRNPTAKERALIKIWFGNDEQKTINRVRRVVTNIDRVFYNRGIIFNCEPSTVSQRCGDETYAYHWSRGTPELSQKNYFSVHMCDYSFREFTQAEIAQREAGLPTKKSGELPLTVIHELTHHRAVGSTDDVELRPGQPAYGPKRCRELAQRTPTYPVIKRAFVRSALNNADNYAFYIAAHAPPVPAGN